MKYYAIYTGCADEQEPLFYVEAIDINDLKNILMKRDENNEPYGMFPGWCPVEKSRNEMCRILNNANDNSDKSKYGVNLPEKIFREILNEKNKPETKVVNFKDYMQYKEILSSIIDSVNKFSEEIYENLFDLACAGKWKEWSDKQTEGTIFNVTEDMLRNTGDKNIDLLWEVLDKIEEMKGKIGVAPRLLAARDNDTK